MAGEGLRVVAVGTREVPREVDHIEAGDDRDLRLAGLVSFVDPPKASAAAALQRLRARGVAVKVVTGDHELVARHVAKELGLEVREALSGTAIDGLDDDALAVRAEDVTLFHRVSPIQKNRVILALSARGHVVGFLGDGINDGPPLHSADVGISVDGAVDVAKEAADLILCRPDLSVLAEGVDEGRRTLVNVTKYVLMATSSNFGNMVSMAAASLFLPFLPLLPVQILLNNLIYDVSELAIPLDDVDDEALARPHRWDIALVRRFMLMVGPISSVFDLLTFWVLLHVVHADTATFRTGWFVESIASQVFVIFAIRTRVPALRGHPNRWLVVAAVSAVAVAVALPFSPLGAWVALVPLRAGTLGLLAAIVAGYLVVVELIKRRAFARIA